MVSPTISVAPESVPWTTYGVTQRSTCYSSVQTEEYMKIQCATHLRNAFKIKWWLTPEMA